MARVYADVNQQMPRAYWDYDGVNITWGVLENYEVVRKIGTLDTFLTRARFYANMRGLVQDEESTLKSSRALMSPTTRNVLSRC